MKYEIQEKRMNWILVNNILYGIMFVVSLIIAFNIVKSKKNFGRIIETFEPRSSLYLVLFRILSAILVVFGIIYFMNDSKIFGLVCIVIGCVCGYVSLEKIILTENGLYYHAKLYLWNEIKHWGFSTGNSFLIITLQNQRVQKIPIQPEYHGAIQTIIKSEKRKKRKTK